MRNRALVLFLVLVSIVLVTIPVSAQVQAEITSPRPNAILRGTVSIQGTASVPDFWKYEVQFAPGLNPPDNAWSVLIVREEPVVNGQLAVWDTTTVPDGTYTLRLRVVHQDGNYEEVYIRPVSVQNAGPPPTQTPAETETPTPLPTLTPVGATSPATETTPIVTQPTIVLPPTATPVAAGTPGAVAQVRPTPSSDLGFPEGVNLTSAFNPRALLSACLTGAGFTLAIFAFVGILMGLRRVMRHWLS